MLENRSVRLVIVGASAAAIFFGLSYALIAAGCSPFVASVSAYAIAFVLAYAAQHKWTFGSQQAHGRSLPRYAASQAFCALLSGLVAQFVAFYGLSAGVASAAAAMAGSASSFLLVRFWVFKPHA